MTRQRIYHIALTTGERNHKIVISFMWNINIYLSPRGRSDVKDVYDGDEDKKASLDVALEYLRLREQREWDRPHAARLQGVENLYEIRFKCCQVQQRPIGYFGPTPNTFTILLWATEKSNALIPKTWVKTVNRRRKQIEDGLASSIPLYPEENDE